MTCLAPILANSEVVETFKSSWLIMGYAFKGDCSGYFFCFCNKYHGQKQLREQDLFQLTVQKDRVHQGGGDTVTSTEAGARSCLIIFHPYKGNRETEKRK